MKKLSTRTLLSLTLLATLAGVAGTSNAEETNWQKAHPRRTEVNERLATQHARIRQEVREGKITHAQAHDLRKEDRQIRREERLMASQNNGHITRSEQRVLNQQENAVSKQIGH